MKRGAGGDKDLEKERERDEEEKVLYWGSGKGEEGQAGLIIPLN